MSGSPASSSADEPPAAGGEGAFYRTFSEKQLTSWGGARRGRIEAARFAQASAAKPAPADFLEVGPGQGAVADLARRAGYRYQAVEPSPILASALRARGVDVRQAFTPPFPGGDASQDVVYADQVLEHMSGIDTARAWVAEARRVLRPGGVLFVVVPDYLKERAFFWDIDYTHNFITTERRVRQLLHDGGFEVERFARGIGLATGVKRDLLAGAAAALNLPGVDALSRYLGAEEWLFKVRKNLFETLTFVARPA
jgi:SAM-dependent methyltransferase